MIRSKPIAVGENIEKRKRSRIKEEGRTCEKSELQNSGVRLIDDTGADLCVPCRTNDDASMEKETPMPQT